MEVADAWKSLLSKSANHLRDGDLQSWLDAIARQLLTGARLVVNNRWHRLVEIEFYYHAPDLHADPFAHRDPIQTHCGRWYFHRTGGTYRNGSFKGLDLTFGDASARAGILIRGLETPDGLLVSGPSLCVDYFLRSTEMKSVAALDAKIGARLAWDATNPLRFKMAECEDRTIYRTARVGLTLRRFSRLGNAGRFVLLPYRYLTEPRRTTKGRLHLILALHAEGRSTAEIRELTGSPMRTIERYVDGFEEGRRLAGLDGFLGVSPKPMDLCRIHGTWDACFANVPQASRQS